MLEQKMQFRFALPAGALALLAFIAGCHVGPAYNPPAPPAITALNFKESTVNFQDPAGWKVASPSDAMLRGNWWEVFNEPELNALEDQLNINNQNIKQYFQNYMEARATISQARAQYWPTISTAPSVEGTRSSGNQVISSAASTGKTTSLWEIPLDLSWTPDLWGKIRNEVNEAKYVSQVSAADLQLEKLTEQASLAQYFFEIRGQDKLQQILNETIKSDQEALDAAQGSYDVGVGDFISVVEAKATVDSVRATAINVALLRAQYEHAIAMLIGKIPTDFSISVKPMIYNAPAIPTGVPSQLLERRPDVAAAERTLAEENAVVGIGYAAYYPNVTITASGGTESALLSHLFDLASGFWTVGGNATETIFNHGLYTAQIHQYEATYNADLAAYRQSVLNAFQQVEDALAGTRIYSQQILQQQDAVAASQQYLDLEQERFKAGVDPFVDVTLAQNTLLTNQETLNAIQIDEMTSAVQLVQALGGGWSKADLPTPDQVGAKTTNADYALQK